MNKKKGGKIASVIDIGSNLLKMRVCQIQKGSLVNLETMEYPVRLGHEVFNSGKISFESLQELSHVLRGYSEIMSEYGVDEYRVVATTALREAKNRDYITDQLKIQNNITVQILEDAQEKSLIYSEILQSLNLKDQTSLLAYIGTGSIGISIFDGKNIIFSQNIPIGSVKLHEMLSDIENETETFYTVVEEYLDGILKHIAFPFTQQKLSTIVLTGTEFEMIANLCCVENQEGKYIIPADLITNLFYKIRVMTPERVSDKYDLPLENAEVLYSALNITNKLLQLTKAEQIISPKIDLWDALTRQMLFPKFEKIYQEHLSVSAISCAKTLAEQYHCFCPHAENVRMFACKIFDKMKPYHGLGTRERLLLELSAILHESGYCSNSKEHLLSGFYLLSNSAIYGLTNREVSIVAHICLSDEFHIPTQDDPTFNQLNREDRLIISKLSAIFRLAVSLDRSQKQKLKDAKIKLNKEILSIHVESNDSLYLEKWAFKLCSPFFKEVFGITPSLIIKSTLI